MKSLKTSLFSPPLYSNEKHQSQLVSRHKRALIPPTKVRLKPAQICADVFWTLIGYVNFECFGSVTLPMVGEFIDIDSSN